DSTGARASLPAMERGRPCPQRSAGVPARNGAGVPAREHLMRRGLILTAGSTRGNLQLAQQAEQAGFDSVFTVEFFNQHAFAVLGAIAATTSRIGIGTGIANAFTRSPLVHATAAMDLDELSGGRMV